MNILIVEDSKAEAHILAQTLRRILDDYPEIRHSGTLREATGLLERGEVEPDLVFLDLKLPDSPEWRETYDTFAPFASRVPIIVMSGNDDPDVAKEVIRNGAEDYIVKGGKKRHVDLLKETIEFALCRHKALRDMAHKDEQCIHWLTGGYSVE